MVGIMSKNNITNPYSVYTPRVGVICIKRDDGSIQEVRLLIKSSDYEKCCFQVRDPSWGRLWGSNQRKYITVSREHIELLQGAITRGICVVTFTPSLAEFINMMTDEPS